MNDREKMYILNDILGQVKPLYLRQRVGARFIEFVDNKIPEGSVVFKDSKIYLNEKHIGNIDFSPYDDIKALGFGNFEIIDKRKGFGTFVINELVVQNKNKYDLIYCFVDKENVSAIEFYKRVGKVHFDKINNKNQYYVTIYESVNQARKQAVKEVLEKLKACTFYSFAFDGNLLLETDIDEIAKEFGVEVKE